MCVPIESHSCMSAINPIQPRWFDFNINEYFVTSSRIFYAKWVAGSSHLKTVCDVNSSVAIASTF